MSALIGLATGMVLLALGILAYAAWTSEDDKDHN